MINLLILITASLLTILLCFYARQRCRAVQQYEVFAGPPVEITTLPRRPREPACVQVVTLEGLARRRALRAREEMRGCCAVDTRENERDAAILMGVRARWCPIWFNGQEN